MFKIQRICAWCEKAMGRIESETNGLTHGICSTCLEKWNKELTDFTKTTEPVKNEILEKIAKKST